MDLWKEAQRIAQGLSAEEKREFRKLYRKDKAANPGLDKTINELADEIKDGLKHIKTPD